MRTPGLDCYAYHATLYCVDCGKDIARHLDAAHVKDDGTTDTYPQPSFFTEVDSPTCCDDCGTLIECSLTSDGVDYCVDQIENHTISREYRDILDHFASDYPAIRKALAKLDGEDEEDDA